MRVWPLAEGLQGNSANRLVLLLSKGGGSERFRKRPAERTGQVLLKEAERK